ncbi:cysteine hydrolase family protein [Cohnella sp. GCM10027633]|uniref:cysteine hydrolase family protein n=1 Tax=unclassified Cohnella TaxID=2636738 RepID=UPI00363F304B
MRVGFIVIDMQAAHLKGVEKSLVSRACEYINHVSGMFRSQGHVVIHVQDIEDRTEANRDEFLTIPEVQMDDNDPVVTKVYTNSFWKTELEQLLRDQGIEMIILAGYAAEHCVLGTYNGARERGFTPVILQHGVLSKHADVITATYRDRNIVSYSVVPYLLGKSAK